MRGLLLPIALVPALLVASPGHDGKTPPRPLVPEYEATISDASLVRRLFRENAWLRDFSGSNLYRGTMVRLGPVLFAVGTEGKDSWKGRLLDYVADRVLDGRPLRLSYFQTPGLVSPFGVTVLGVGAGERPAAHLLLEGLRSGPDVEVDPAAPPGGSGKVKVTPVVVRSQRFAAVEGEGCLALARDPRVAATLGRRCAVEPRLPAAALDVDLGSAFSAWSAVLEKLVGIGPSLHVRLDYDAANARLTPARAEVALRKGHLVRAGKVPEELLKAIPANALFFATLVVPDPGPLSVESAEAYFRTARSRPDATPVPVTLLYLGMRPGAKGRSEAMTVLLVPQPKVDDAALAKLDALFGASTRHEVHVSRACPGTVALSPSLAALEKVADACAGRQPSFVQMSPRMVSRFTARPVSSGGILNLGAFLESALVTGWNARTASESTQAVPAPPELVSAMQLLDRLPVYAFTGSVAGDLLVMVGGEP